MQNFGKASANMRATAKNYGKRKMVGIIRDGKYINPDTGEPIEITGRKVPDISTININRIGGVE
jgi:hypothetical protein